LLDQLPRNLYRGTARAFATDPQALALCQQGLLLGHDAALAPVERVFHYLPLEHAENLEAQNLSIALFRELRNDAPPGAEASFDGFIKHADSHRQIIERFGRYPHRNAVLGRVSTPAEQQYLAGSAATFGQAPAAAAGS
jgi:uncharacterized protein (DUF924 family)